MQVASLSSNTAAAPASQAEETGSRADQFSRVLESAFYGAGSKAVARGAEPSAPEAAARRQETRPVERSSERPADRPAPEAQPAAPREKPRDPVSQRVDSKPAEKPATPAGEASSAEQPATGKADAQPSERPAETAGRPEGEGGEEIVTDEDAKPVVEAAPDAAVILALLQTQMQPAGEAVSVLPADAQQMPVVVAADAAKAGAASVVDPAAAVTASVETKPVPAAAVPAPVLPLPEMAEKPSGLTTAPDPAAVAKAMTETSVAALLSQQQDVTPEELAAIQQALLLQGQAKPANGEAAMPAKPEGKTAGEAKSLLVEVQSATTPKALVVDQATLLSMQGDEAAAQDAALPPQQAQPQPHPQPAGAEVKFAAALQMQHDASPAQNNATALQNASLTGQQQVSPLANPGTPAPQAAQHAAQTHANSRHPSAFVPPGEQVAVHIKRATAEGLDKISIKLDPGNLGKVEVKMEVGHDGRLMAVISADKADTLAMLQRDAASLEQSLREAGLKTSSDSLSFTLRDQGQQADGRDQGAGGRQRGHGSADYSETGQRTDPALLAAANAERAAAARGGLDIRI